MNIKITFLGLVRSDVKQKTYRLNFNFNLVSELLVLVKYEKVLNKSKKKKWSKLNYALSSTIANILPATCFSNDRQHY
jgi:hypothetical protein